MHGFDYSGDHLREVVFPLGGVGTGSIGLEGRGALRDWEIFNRPNKNTVLPHTFAALWCRPEAGAADARVLQGPKRRDFIGNPAAGGYGMGVERGQGDGLPHFSDAVFTGRFPRARVTFHEPNHPLAVSLDAWSPFVPLDPDASGMPVACFAYRLRNATARPVEAAVAFNLFNPVGHRIATDRPPAGEPQAVNRVRDEGGVRAVVMSHEGLEASDPRFGTLALATDHPSTTALAHWPRPPQAAWFDAAHAFWDAFSADGALPDNHADTEPGRPTSGSIALRVRLAPGERATLPIFLAWSFPNFERYWGWDEAKGAPPTWRNHYATRWPDALAAATDFAARRRELEARTRAFERALHDTTLPGEAVEAVANTATTLRTPTCLRYEDGTFWAWEGCSAKHGCCPGSCTHVWNYALSHAFLFPSLQKSMRRSEYEHGIPDDDEGAQGKVTFRIPLPLEQPPASATAKAAVDGQLGGVIQLYRDWRMGADEAHLQRLWPHARKALEYAWVAWDADRDGLIERTQHNTYDIEFEGPNPLAQFMYLGALRAGEAMARHLGEEEAARTYRELFESGRGLTEQRLFQGEYFHQPGVPGDASAPKYQHGEGCLSDQLLGQLGARVAGLGPLVDPAKIRSALQAVSAHNFRDPLGDHANPQRIYAVGDEPGLLLCSWPNGGRPPYPFVYSDEVWTGIEYQVAAHLIFEGLREEGLRILRGVRERYDGARRNPYNEIECGSHYARALASWGAFLALAGFHYDAVERSIALEPRDAEGEPVRALFTAGTGWGRFEWRRGELRLSPEEGEIAVARVSTPEGTWEADGEAAIVRGGESAVFPLEAA